MSLRPSPALPFAALALALASLAACVPDPRSFESPPMTVDSPMGPVVCQLYTRRVVRWDRAISVPSGMTVEQGDQICIAAGERWRKS